MPAIINTNIASLNAQRNLFKSTTQLGRTFQRLSSGLRINSARDDAAGLAISNRFTAQIRGLNQAPSPALLPRVGHVPLPACRHLEQPSGRHKRCSSENL